MVFVTVKTESWPIAGVFTISRGSKTVADVLVVEMTDSKEKPSVVGRGEGVPYRHYNETMEKSVADIQAIIPKLEALPEDKLAEEIQKLPNGAAKNAVDCAFWDFRCKKQGKRIWELTNYPEPKPLTTAYTLSLDTAEKMGESAKKNAHRPLLKLKLGCEEDLCKVEAVRSNAPNSRLIVDANEGWTIEVLERLCPKLAKLNVELIEQPLPAGVGTGRKFEVPLCADESLRDISQLPELAQCYSFVNIKLDKTGGLTMALEVAKLARKLGLGVMLGCMVSTSLSMAPAAFVASSFAAEFVDLDGPLLLQKDRAPAVVYEGSKMMPAQSQLWG